MTASFDAERVEREIRRQLDGTFRRIHYQDAMPKFVTYVVAADFVPDYKKMFFGGNK